MKCIYCGVWTEVMETRAGPNWSTKRTRLCANGHRFPTYEVVKSALASQRDQRTANRTIQARINRWKRNLQILKDPRPPAQVARVHGITTANVRVIRSKLKRASGLMSSSSPKSLHTP